MSAWEYLDTDIFQSRFAIVGAYLRGKIRNKVIVDLNCGASTSLNNFLTPDYALYVANDVAFSRDCEIPCVRLLKEDDTKMLARLQLITSVVDVFVHMGGIARLSMEDVESKTDSISGREIVDFYKPKIVILEAIRSFALGLYKDYLPVMKENYRMAHVISLVIDNEEYVTDRVFRFYERLL